MRHVAVAVLLGIANTATAAGPFTETPVVISPPLGVPMLHGVVGRSGAIPDGIDAEALDKLCGTNRWEIWYERDPIGRVLPSSVESYCQSGQPGG